MEDKRVPSLNPAEGSRDKQTSLVLSERANHQKIDLSAVNALISPERCLRGEHGIPRKKRSTKSTWLNSSAPPETHMTHEVSNTEQRG